MLLSEQCSLDVLSVHCSVSYVLYVAFVDDPLRISVVVWLSLCLCLFLRVSFCNFVIPDCVRSWLSLHLFPCLLSGLHAASSPLAR